MKTIEVIKNTASLISENTSLSEQESKIEAEEIFRFVSRMDRSKLYLNMNSNVSKSVLENINHILTKRMEKIPLSYILKKHTFYKSEFYVDENVLIPRTETESIIDQILKMGDQLFDHKGRCNFIDAGCGSGCVGISVANERSKWNVILSDAYFSALRITKKNLKLCRNKNVSLVCADWLNPFRNMSFDFIFSNPPYIEKNDSRVEKSVFLHEPHAALFSDKGGFYDISRIIKLSSKSLCQSGILFLENGIGQSKGVCDLLESNDFTDISIHIDYNGRDRFTSSRKK